MLRFSFAPMLAMAADKAALDLSTATYITCNNGISELLQLVAASLTDPGYSPHHLTD